MATIELKLDKDFDERLNYLKNKYGKEMQKINGVSDEQLDYTAFIDNFIDVEGGGSVADKTIDSSANVTHKDVAVLLNEMNKPHMKLLSFNKIYYEIKKMYGVDKANEWLDKEYTGLLYMHDAHSTSFYSYCYAYELQNLAEKGLYFLPKSNTSPAKHLTTFLAHLREFIVYVSNRTAGACALPSFFIYTWYFWHKDVEEGYYLKDPEYYRRQLFQQFIFEVNQIHTRIIQSAYTNLIIMDRNYIEEIFGDRKFPDGSYVIDHVEEIIEHEKVYMETEAKIRHEMFHTFPVYSYALLFQNGKFVDEDFAKWAVKQQLEWFDANIYMGNSVTNLASCCFDATQKVLVNSAKYGILHDTIKNICELDDDNLKVYHCGTWADANKVILPARPMYRITTSNGKEAIVTDNHLVPTMTGDKKASDISTSDYIAFSLSVLPKENNLEFTYDQGYLVGAYILHGEISDNSIKLKEIPDKYTLNSLKESLNDFDVEEYSCFKDGLCINSSNLIKFINNYVTELNGVRLISTNCLKESTLFRRGIVDALIELSEPKYTIVSNSKEFIKSVELVFTSLGTDTKYFYDNEIHKLKVDNYLCSKDTDYYVGKNNILYLKVSKIEPFEPTTDKCYCFEMKNKDDPYFTLPNGMITHNCRMLNDISKQKEKQFQSSIGGSLVEIGSVKVSTINLMRIALDSNKDKDAFIKELTDTVKLNMLVLDRVRHIIKRNIEKGLLPNYSFGLINLDKQTVTNGLTAMYEAIEYMGLIERDKFGNVSYSKEGLDFASKIMDTVNELQDEFNEKHDYNVSLEIIPGESANAKLCAKDNILFNRHEKFIYSNQWTSLMEKSTIEQRTSLAAVLDQKAGGGQILHITLGTNKISFEQCWNMVVDMAKKGVIYMAFNPVLSLCENHHTFWGDTCPICGAPKSDEVTRIVGYFVPVSAYSTPRAKEENQRYKYKTHELGNDVVM